MHDPDVGERLDQYELTELVARSGMASIFRAVDTLTGSTVAIKVPYLQFESDVLFRQRFQREGEIGQRLHHPNIIRVLTPIRKSRMYIAMEYVEGVSLRAIMGKQHIIATERAIDFASQICTALVYMHGEHVVHRDLKPENILVTASGQIKIMDFGIALDELARHLTWSGSSTVGTPDYMAPEQISGGHGDARTDIYALGAMTYEMLTGALPYAGENVYNVMRAKTEEDPIPPSRVRPDLDPRIEEIILHAIERRPPDRYGAAAEMLQDLRNPSRLVISGRAKRLHPDGLKRRPMRRLLWTVLAFSSLVVVFSLLIWLANRPPAAIVPASALHSRSAK